MSSDMCIHGGGICFLFVNYFLTQEVLLPPETKAVVKSRKKLNLYLKNENYQYASTLTCATQINTGLEKSLSEFTDLDILDEENKFICHNCK